MEPTQATDDQIVGPPRDDTPAQLEQPAAASPPGDAQANTASAPNDAAQDAQRNTSRNALVVGGIWMLVLAACLLLNGLCSGALYLILPFTSRNIESNTQTNILLGSIGGFGIVFGAVLAWQGITTLRGGRSIPAARAFPPVLALVFAFVGAVLLGIGTLTLPALAVYLFPPWHLLAASLPPLVLLAYAARRLGAASGLRALLVSFSWGAFAGTTISFVLEILTALMFVALAVVVVSSLPNGRDLLEQLRTQLSQMQRTRDLSVMLQWLSQPLVLVALLFYLAVIIPLIEETVKALVVAFIDPRRTQPADAVLWGMGAGAGFAVVENVLNGGAMVSAWAPLILSRIGATIVHVANGALMGRGWYAARAERRWGKLLLAYGASVLFHAVWNGMAVLLGVQSPGLSQAFPASTEMFFAGALGLVMVVLALAGLAWIVYTVRRQSRRQAVSSAVQ